MPTLLARKYECYLPLGSLPQREDDDASGLVGKGVDGVEAPWSSRETTGSSTPRKLDWSSSV